MMVKKHHRQHHHHHHHYYHVHDDVRTNAPMMKSIMAVSLLLSLLFLLAHSHHDHHMIDDDSLHTTTHNSSHDHAASARSHQRYSHESHESHESHKSHDLRVPLSLLTHHEHNDEQYEHVNILAQPRNVSSMRPRPRPRPASSIRRKTEEDVKEMKDDSITTIATMIPTTKSTISTSTATASTTAIRTNPKTTHDNHRLHEDFVTKCTTYLLSDDVTGTSNNSNSNTNTNTKNDRMISNIDSTNFLIYYSTNVSGTICYDSTSTSTSTSTSHSQSESKSEPLPCADLTYRQLDPILQLIFIWAICPPSPPDDTISSSSSTLSSSSSSSSSTSTCIEELLSQGGHNDEKDNEEVEFGWILTGTLENLIHVANDVHDYCTTVWYYAGDFHGVDVDVVINGDGDGDGDDDDDDGDGDMNGNVDESENEDGDDSTTPTSSTEDGPPNDTTDPTLVSNANTGQTDNTDENEENEGTKTTSRKSRFGWNFIIALFFAMFYVCGATYLFMTTQRNLGLRDTYTFTFQFPKLIKKDKENNDENGDDVEEGYLGDTGGNRGNDNNEDEEGEQEIEVPPMAFRNTNTNENDGKEEEEEDIYIPPEFRQKENISIATEQTQSLKPHSQQHSQPQASPQADNAMMMMMGRSGGTSSRKLIDKKKTKKVKGSTCSKYPVITMGTGTASSLPVIEENDTTTASMHNRGGKEVVNHHDKNYEDKNEDKDEGSTNGDPLSSISSPSPQVFPIVGNNISAIQCDDVENDLDAGLDGLNTTINTNYADVDVSGLGDHELSSSSSSPISATAPIYNVQLQGKNREDVINASSTIPVDNEGRQHQVESKDEYNNDKIQERKQSLRHTTTTNRRHSSTTKKTYYRPSSSIPVPHPSFMDSRLPTYVSNPAYAEAEGIGRGEGENRRGTENIDDNRRRRYTTYASYNVTTRTSSSIPTSTYRKKNVQSWIPHPIRCRNGCTCQTRLIDSA